MCKKGEIKMSLAVIHFSDIHLKGTDDIIFSRIDELKKACASVLPNDGLVVIAISGDIAFSGTREQYNLARDLLNELVEYIIQQTKSDVKFAFVPGNHDCDFSVNDSARDVLVSAVTPNIVDENYYNIITKVQKEYFQFASDFGLISNAMISSLEFSTPGGKVLFLLENTAWMSVLHENPGKIVLPPIFFKSIVPSEYKVVFSVLHHPVNWMNPDYSDDFTNYIRNTSDIVLVGHEHKRDGYEVVGNSWTVYEHHGKELQDSNSTDSGFSVLIFDDAYQNCNYIDYTWNNNSYSKSNMAKQYHKNIASLESVLQPNAETKEFLNDIGFIVNHFAKTNVVLPDLFVWPDFNKGDFSNEQHNGIKLKENALEDFKQNHINILVGSDTSGKTALAKMIYLSNITEELCCLYIDGAKIGLRETKNINDFIEQSFIEQYSKNKLEEFYQLPKEKRVVIVDDFDNSKVFGDRRNSVIDFLSSYFGTVFLFASSDIEMPTLLSAKSIQEESSVTLYEILPLGNRKREELIRKWYTLNEYNRDSEEIEKRIDAAIGLIDTFIGNGSGFMPANPIYIINALQNGDAMIPTYNGSQYGFLYETMIQKSLSKIAPDYSFSGAYNIDISILSYLAFYMLKDKKKIFSEKELFEIINTFTTSKKIDISEKSFIKKMCNAQIFCKDLSNGNSYKFKYPYIFYYFAGHYIAYHLNLVDVKEEIEYMSGRLYNEDYGNIIIFVCHFANNTDIIETTLLNAYITLDKYDEFDFTKSNSVFSDIDSVIEALLPTTVGDNSEVASNKEKRLSRLDDIGINDGNVQESKDVIEDEIGDKEKDLAAISAAFKTLDVMGQILKNYPGDIDGKMKVQVIDEIHKLGMRSVQAIVLTMGYLEETMVEYVLDRVTKDNPNVRKSDVVLATKKIINMMLAGMVRGMINKIALSLDSKHLLLAATESLERDNSIASKLILAELKINCLNQFSFQEVDGLKKELERNNERFASGILGSIISQYLKFNRCDYKLRSKLCNLFGFSEHKVMIDNTKQLKS